MWARDKREERDVGDPSSFVRGSARTGKRRKPAAYVWARDKREERDVGDPSSFARGSVRANREGESDPASVNAGQELNVRYGCCD